MAKKNKREKIILEDVELKPQVIGYTYKKKSNIGRVILIFIIFALAVYYINDLSLFINNLLGKETNKNIQNLTQNNNDKNNEEDNPENREIIYNIYENYMIITNNEVTLTNFNLSNQQLSFDISNNTAKEIDLLSKKFFIETYSENKTLLERFKVDIKNLQENAKTNYKLDIKQEFYYIVFVEKTIDDYPNISLNNENGVGLITCNKGIETITYKFNNDELVSIEHTITDNQVDDNYYTRYSNYQKKSTSYSNIEGITSTFTGRVNGYSAVFNINLAKVSLEEVNEKYYFNYKEVPKVIKFEMETYGFQCDI